MIEMQAVVVCDRCGSRSSVMENIESELEARQRHEEFDCFGWSEDDGEDVCPACAARLTCPEEGTATGSAPHSSSEKGSHGI